MVETFTSEVPDISSAISVLSSMLTPAILILAAASILSTVSTRLIRVMDRVRELGKEIKQLARSEAAGRVENERREFLFLLLRSSSRRARILQKAMSSLYAAIGAFVVTSIVIGILSLSDVDVGWVALAVGFVGALLFLVASSLLIVESRMAIRATGSETKFVWRWSESHFASMPEVEPPE